MIHWWAFASIPPPSSISLCAPHLSTSSSIPRTNPLSRIRSFESFWGFWLVGEKRLFRRGWYWEIKESDELLNNIVAMQYNAFSGFVLLRWFQNVVAWMPRIGRGVSPLNLFHGALVGYSKVVQHKTHIRLPSTKIQYPKVVRLVVG